MTRFTARHLLPVTAFLISLLALVAAQAGAAKVKPLLVKDLAGLGGKQ